jgi:hypothetical protein
MTATRARAVQAKLKGFKVGRTWGRCSFEREAEYFQRAR